MLVNPAGLLTDLTPTIDELFDIGCSADAGQEVASGLEIRIDLERLGQMLLGGRNVFALEMQISHLVLGHRRGLALRQFGHRTRRVTCIEQSPGQSLPVRLIVGLQLDCFAQVRFRRSEISGPCVEFA